MEIGDTHAPKWVMSPNNRDTNVSRDTEMELNTGMVLRVARAENGWQKKSRSSILRLTSIDYPQIGGKFTTTTGGLTKLFYGCKD